VTGSGPLPVEEHFLMPSFFRRISQLEKLRFRARHGKRGPRIFWDFHPPGTFAIGNPRTPIQNDSDEPITAAYVRLG
jgi:hypothetical protein